MELLTKILQNQRLMKLVKFSLSHLIQRLVNGFGFDRSSFFSDNVHRFGNIGYSTSGDNEHSSCGDIGYNTNDYELQTKMGYILSPESTIREKVSAITNSLINGSDSHGKNKQNTQILYDFIIGQNITDSDSFEGSWVHERFRQINQLSAHGFLADTDPTHFWAPIYLLYPKYRMKCDCVKGLLNGSDKFVSSIDGIIEQELTEPLSVFEKNFLGQHGFNGSAREKLPMMTGRYIYKNMVQLFPESATRDKSIIVGGISGHTMLLLELALICNIKWIPILFACVITQTPHHHSIAEIIDVLRELDLLSPQEKNESLYLNVVSRLAESMCIRL